MKLVKLTKIGLLVLLFSGLISRVKAEDYLFGNPYLDCEQVLSGVVPCKRASPITSVTRRYNFPTSDFSWTCNSIGSLEFDFFNSSGRYVQTVIIEGTTRNTRLTSNVSVPPGQSKYVYMISSGSFCRNEERARLYFEYELSVGGECLERYTAREISETRETCRAEEAAQRSRNIIYDNCVLSKSRGVDQSALRNVRSICREISINPSLLQRLRWGQ